MGRLGAFGLRAANPGGPPIGSGPGCIWVGGATAAATVTVFSKFWASWPNAGTQIFRRDGAVTRLWSFLPDMEEARPENGFGWSGPREGLQEWQQRMSDWSRYGFQTRRWFLKGAELLDGGGGLSTQAMEDKG